MKKRIEKNIGILVFMVIWAGLVAWFWLDGLFGKESPEFAPAYSLLAFYVLLPSASIVSGVLYGIGEGKSRYFFPASAGILEVLLGLLTFRLANSLAQGESLDVYFRSFLEKDNWDMFLFTFIPALLGVVIGMIYKKVHNTSAKK